MSKDSLAQDSLSRNRSQTEHWASAVFLPPGLSPIVPPSSLKQCREENANNLSWSLDYLLWCSFLQEFRFRAKLLLLFNNVEFHFFYKTGRNAVLLLPVLISWVCFFCCCFGICCVYLFVCFLSLSCSKLFGTQRLPWNGTMKLD